MESVDVLKFTGVASYTAKLEQYTKLTNLKDAILTGIGRIGKYRVALGVMDFGFLGGSMGVGRRRKAHALDRSGDGQGPAGHHHFHQRGRAHVRRDVQPDAIGQDLRRAGLSRQKPNCPTSAC